MHSSVTSKLCTLCAAVQRLPAFESRSLYRSGFRQPCLTGQAVHTHRFVRLYSEGEIIDAVKAKLKIQGQQSDISESLRRQLEPLARAWDRYATLQTARGETARQIDHLKDDDMRELFQSEIVELDEQITELVHQLPALVLPVESTDALPVMVSLNAGIGGDEATACTALLSRAYQRYAEIHRWTVEVMSSTVGAQTKSMAGVKEITMKITAKDANVYETLRWEGGVHRFQRIPPNDTKGRVQTSTVAVVVLPVISDDAETDLVDAKDVKTEVMRSRGAGGQHVNKTESAVRLTHVPTGISVSMQDSRSQHQNRAWAWDILRSRLFERKQAELQSQRRNRRQEVLKGTDRSDRVRSYSFSQDRVTDHRVGFSTSNVDAVLDGDLDPIFYALKEDHERQRLQSLIEDA